MPHDTPSFNEQSPRRLRRVIIEERQAKTIEHVRASRGYAGDVSLHAHDQHTFRLINQRKELDELPLAGFVVPALDEWKHWTKMGDWDSRNRLLEDLTNKVRRREAPLPKSRSSWWCVALSGGRSRQVCGATAV